MNVIISIISGAVTAIVVILFKDYIELRYYFKRNAKRRFKLAILSFILKSRLPQFSWRSTDDDKVRKVIQLIHLKPIYREFHNELIIKPPHIKFKDLPPEKIKDLNCKSFKEAEIRTICHVSIFLFDEQNNIYDFPAKYWIEWLEENGIDYYKHKR